MQQQQQTREHQAFTSLKVNTAQTAEQKFAEVEAAARSLFIQHNQDLTQLTERQTQAQSLAEQLADVKQTLIASGECKSELDAACEALTERIRANLERVKASEDACTALAHQFEAVEVLTSNVAPALLDKARSLQSAIAAPESVFRRELLRVKALLNGKSPGEWRSATTEWRRRLALICSWIAFVEEHKTAPPEWLTLTRDWITFDGQRVTVELPTINLPSAKECFMQPELFSAIDSAVESVRFSLAELKVPLAAETDDQWRSALRDMKMSFERFRESNEALAAAETRLGEAENALQVALEAHAKMNQQLRTADEKLADLKIEHTALCSQLNEAESALHQEEQHLLQQQGDLLALEMEYQSDTCEMHLRQQLLEDLRKRDTERLQCHSKLQEDLKALTALSASNASQDMLLAARRDDLAGTEQRVAAAAARVAELASAEQALVDALNAGVTEPSPLLTLLSSIDHCLDVDIVESVDYPPDNDTLNILLNGVAAQLTAEIALADDAAKGADDERMALVSSTPTRLRVGG